MDEISLNESEQEAKESRSISDLIFLHSSYGFELDFPLLLPRALVPKDSV